ncbi:MAG: hypothetical protein HY706_20260 [Candidatus Hydrogenedentes bacterium]|nr:hypothetical protein [Candidatus Hydrogenedentota bacterium]
MPNRHPKSIRRELLKILYARYTRDPLDMVGPQDLLEAGPFTREELIPNLFYLSDRGLVELMTDYKPPMVSGVRISPDGIDLIENEFEFNLRFPPTPDALEAGAVEVPILMERLVEEAEFSALDGEKRRMLLRDIQYLRDELARPVQRWRSEVIGSVVGWLEGYFNGDSSALPSLPKLKQRISESIR